jgi:GDPmannose 4,6-dehydratase
MRPEELKELKGDSSKIRTELRWVPEYTFETLMDEIIEYWIDKIKSGNNRLYWGKD